MFMLHGSFFNYVHPGMWSMQAVWPVPIPPRCVLKEIIRRINLQVHGFGVVIEDCRVMVGWIDMDVPPSETGGVRGRQVFYVDEAGTRLEAMENICDTAVVAMVSQFCVEVREFSFGKLKDLQKRVVHADDLYSMFADALDASRANCVSMQHRYAGLFNEASSVLKKYNDVVPIERAPVNRMEELVCALSMLVGKGMAMSGAYGSKVSYWVYMLVICYVLCVMSIISCVCWGMQI